MTLLRAYQEPAAAHLAAHRALGDRALVVCPAGGGKTLIAASGLARCVDPFDKIGWACNTREQVEQGEAALRRCGVEAVWVRCVAGLRREDVEGLNILVLDECHHLMAETWHVLAYFCGGAVWGLTATPKTGNPDRDWAFNRFWGGCVHIVPRADVMAGGHLAHGVVRVLDIDEPGEFDAGIDAGVAAHLFEHFANWKAFRDEIAPHLAAQDFTSPEAVELLGRIAKKFPVDFDTEAKRKQWRLTLRHLADSAARNAVVVETARREIAAGQSVLVLVAEIEHGKQLAERIGGAVVAHSKMGTRARREAIAAFRDGSLRCLVATSLADEGLDVPRASVLILACPGRSGAKIEQRTGRVMRPHEGKGVGLVYDFADRGVGMAHNQHRARLKIYRRLGYSVEAYASLQLFAA